MDLNLGMSRFAYRPGISISSTFYEDKQLRVETQKWL